MTLDGSGVAVGVEGVITAAEDEEKIGKAPPTLTGAPVAVVAAEELIADELLMPLDPISCLGLARFYLP